MIRAGTRRSKLAQFQTALVLQRLTEAANDLETDTVFQDTRGDLLADRPLPEIGGKGLFTAELETALREKRIDIAVHSLKDLPTVDAPGLVIGAVLDREDVRDALVAGHGRTLDELPSGAVVGTSSNRRTAQLRMMRSDIDVRSVRGNVPTRVEKMRAGQYDAVVLAVAGLERLGMRDAITEIFEPGRMLPAPGQGALAVQCRADDDATRRLLESVEDPDVRAAVTAERAFLGRLEAGCSSPVAAFARVTGDRIMLQGLVASLDGKRVIRLEGDGADARALGIELAEEAFARGAGEVMRDGA
ncbi:MAG: hydroxymethylbilane synthase [Rhodothermales bacterium]|nr:hydroxymethylbilane synthase [Rhodothermales bacterium]